MIEMFDPAAQDDLFGAWVPEWMKGETLYGLCSRYHRIAGHRLASITCQRLFGHPRAGLNHDLPGRVDDFSRRVHGQLGSAEDILLERTVLAYYLRFRTESDTLSVLSQLRESGPASMKARLGWLATRMGAAHPLRACLSCVEQSIREHDAATWMLLHQLPGVWYCPKHHELLLVARVKVNGIQRFQWLLPDDVTLDLAGPMRVKALLDAVAIERMRLVAEATAELLAMPRGFVIESSRFADTCLSRLVDRRMASPNGRLRPQLIGPEFAGFLGSLAALPERNALCVGPDAALYSLRRLLQPRERCPHPLRCILAAIWLFGSWKEFTKAYETTPDLVSHLVNEKGSNSTLALEKSTRASQDEQSFLHLVREQGCSVRSASKRIGINIQTGLTWASRAGVQVSRRPKKLNLTTRKRVIAALRDGASKKAAADLGCISVVTVTRILGSEAGLQAAWRKTRESRQKIDARSQLIDAIRNNPSAGIKQIRGLVPAAYVWLYRHDRTWLDAKAKTISCKVRGNHASINWGARDVEFAREVDSTRQALGTSPATAIRTMQIVRLVPGLQSKLRRLDQLPLTRAALGSH